MSLTHCLDPFSVPFDVYLIEVNFCQFGHLKREYLMQIIYILEMQMVKCSKKSFSRTEIQKLTFPHLFTDLFHKDLFPLVRINIKRLVYNRYVLGIK